MIIKELEIESFRNLRHVKFSAGKHFNLLIGKNAQGKSNFLEALYCLALGRSHRTTKEEGIISFDSPFARIMSFFSDPGGDFSLEISWERSSEREIKKVIKYNGKILSKLVDLINKAPMVLFVLEDMNLVKSSPEDRRRFLDLLCSLLYPPYVVALRDYRRVLESRNRWLRKLNEKHDRNLGEVYSEKLCQLGAELIYRRLQILESLKTRTFDFYSKMFQQEMPELQYRCTVKNITKRDPENIEKAFCLTLKILSDREMKRHFTLAGPHRDDFDLKQMGRSMKDFASTGEIRSVVAAFKIAAVDLILERTGKEPIVLIDDSLNEFDPDRMNLFLNYLGEKCQVFITATELNTVFEKLESVTSYVVSEGSIEQCNLSHLRARLKEH